MTSTIACRLAVAAVLLIASRAVFAQRLDVIGSAQCNSATEARAPAPNVLVVLQRDPAVRAFTDASGGAYRLILRAPNLEVRGSNTTLVFLTGSDRESFDFFIPPQADRIIDGIPAVTLPPTLLRVDCSQISREDVVWMEDLPRRVGGSPSPAEEPIGARLTEGADEPTRPWVSVALGAVRTLSPPQPAVVLTLSGAALQTTNSLLLGAQLHLLPALQLTSLELSLATVEGAVGGECRENNNACLGVRAQMGGFQLDWGRRHRGAARIVDLGFGPQLRSRNPRVAIFPSLGGSLDYIWNLASDGSDLVLRGNVGVRAQLRRGPVRIDLQVMWRPGLAAPVDNSAIEVRLANAIHWTAWLQVGTQLGYSIANRPELSYGSDWVLGAEHMAFANIFARVGTQDGSE
jgi:hypothetical protein